MANPVSPSSSHYEPSEKAQERQKMFELEWEINLLGAYLTASAKNNPLLQHLNNMKSSLVESKVVPSQMATEVNQLISKINFQSGGDLPSFEFSQISPKSALASVSKTLEKTMTQMAKNKMVPTLTPVLIKEGTNLFKAISSGLYDRNPHEGFLKLNQFIETARLPLPAIPLLPS